MKKLLVLVMVLAMASIASAAISVAMTADVDAGVATISLIDNDPAAADSELVGYAGFANLQIQVTSGTYVGSWFETNGPYAPALSPWNTNFAPVASTAVAGDGFIVTLNGLYASAPLGPPILADGVVATFSFTIDGPATVSAVGGNFNAVTDLGTLEVIPEPITVALLGLGGLFIRRRK